MFRILLALLLMTQSAWATQWRAGTGENTILGSSNAADIDYNSYNSIVKPLDNLLSSYCNEYLQYASSSTLTVVAGSVVVSNAGGTARLMLQDTTNTTITSANLDTGVFAASTTYYVYATAATTSSTSSTYYISVSNTAPSGQTYYYQIGSFSTDGSTNINPSNIFNNRGFVNVKVLSEYDYGSSSSSYTNKSGGIKFAHGQVSVGAKSSSPITNLPFTSSSSYQCTANQVAGTLSLMVGPAAVSYSSGSTASISNAADSTFTISWICIGT